MLSKICSVCNLDLPLDTFPETKGRVAAYKTVGQKNLPTHENRCRPCKAEYARNWRAQAPKNYKGSGKMLRIPTEDRFLVSAISERLTQAKERAKKYNQPEPDIDRDYLYQLFKTQKGICPLSGVSLKVEKRSVACLSLDKINADLGYVQGNVQWVAWAVNRAKGDMNEDVFFDMCRQIVEYQKVQRLS